MEFYSLNQILNLIEEIANAHPQVHSWNFGQEFEISASEQVKYPLVWCDVKSSEIVERTNTVTVSTLVLDRADDASRNEKDTLSDTLSIAQDIIAEIKNPIYSNYFLINNNFSLEPMRDVLPDTVNGWKFDVQFELAFTSNRCQVPQSI